MRRSQTGEKRLLGTVEKIECDKQGMFFLLKTEAKTFKLAVSSPQTIQIRVFTPDVEQMQPGCNVKRMDVPVVFTFKEAIRLTDDAVGELIALEFVPKSFKL